MESDGIDNFTYGFLCFYWCFQHELYTNKYLPHFVELHWSKITFTYAIFMKTHFCCCFFFYPASQKDGFNRWPKNLPDFTAAENHHEEISWKEQRHLTLTIKLFGWIKRNVLPSFKTWLYFFLFFKKSIKMYFPATTEGNKKW